MPAKVEEDAPQQMRHNTIDPEDVESVPLHKLCGQARNPMEEQMVAAAVFLGSSLFVAREKNVVQNQCS